MSATPIQPTLFPVHPLRILITGGRNFDDPNLIARAFQKIVAENPGVQMVLISGHCPTGADHIAEELAASLGWEIELHPAQWKIHGKAAGPIRNQEMVNAGADVCLAFPDPDSRGTWHCVDTAKKAGIYTKVYQAGKHTRVYPSDPTNPWVLRPTDTQSTTRS